MANRIEAEVTVANIYEYEREAYAYGMETAYIYSMVGEDGTNYVWKTTSILGYEVEDPEGWIIREKKGKEVRYGYVPVNKDDKIRIKATVKGESEYKGKPQTEVNRVKVLERTYRAETYEERMERLEKEREAKKNEQIASLRDGDIIWEMPYKQYKDHYSDCETVTGSFRRSKGGHSYISVIVRNGRLKASGVRGESFQGYELTNESGEIITYRAVCEENALRRANKEFPEHTWKCTHVYFYQNYHKDWF